MPNRNKNKNPIQKKLGSNNQKLPTVAKAGTVKGSKAEAFKQRQARKNNAEIAPKAPVVDTRSELEIKFEEYAEFLKDKDALDKRETKLKTYFIEKLEKLEDKEGNGANLYNEKKTAYFKNTLTKVYKFPDAIQVEENKIKHASKLLKNDKDRAKLDGSADLCDIKKAMKYYEPKAKGGKK
tara:strand:+ start:64 stop:606 length:543 start_codon:yes stop_codon:yes gene_type:complete